MPGLLPNYPLTLPDETLLMFKFRSTHTVNLPCGPPDTCSASECLQNASSPAQMQLQGDIVRRCHSPVPWKPRWQPTRVLAGSPTAQVSPQKLKIALKNAFLTLEHLQDMHMCCCVQETCSWQMPVQAWCCRASACCAAILRPCCCRAQA